MLQVVWAGAYRAPREVNWWTGLMMGGLVLAFALTGYLLPWDQKGYWATQVATGIMGSVPGGEPMQQFVQGGSEYGNLTLTRFFALHVFVLPLALAGLLGLHLMLFRKHGVTPPAKYTPAELEAKTQPFWPNQLFLDTVAMAVCAAVLVLLTFKSHGAELFAPADPASNFVARPEWYFLFLFQLLKYFQGPLQIVATVLLPGAVAAFLFALPFIDRSKSRLARTRVPVLAGVATLMAGVTVLTALAMVEDGKNETFQHGLEQAHAEATKARALAKEGVSPVGGTAVFDNDPEQKARNLFREHCGGCHTIEGKGSEDAPVLDGFASRTWIAGVIRDPRHKQFFGATKHNTMEPLKPEDASDEDLKGLVEYVVSLSGTGEATDAALVAKGKELWDKKLECSSCHEIEAGKDSTGPTLAGRGTAQWVARVIGDSAQKDLFGDTAEMPKFAGKLAPPEIEALAKFVAERGGEPKKAETAPAH
jgi:ubiquinol-cytochrome c reductase cytochrome b subunit